MDVDDVLEFGEANVSNKVEVCATGRDPSKEVVLIADAN